MKLKYYPLSSRNLLEYLYLNLHETNTLSDALIKSPVFTKGRFFTLLPQGIDMSKIQDFNYGGIAQGLRNQFKLFILNKLKIDSNLTCIIDDFNSNYIGDYNDSLFLDCGFYFNKEIYYCLTGEYINLEKIDECLYASECGWHSLIIFSRIRLVSKKLNSINIQEICNQAQLIMIRAYDGEGYIFWEKNF